MTNITIPRAVLEEAIERLQRHINWLSVSKNKFCIQITDEARGTVEKLCSALAESEKPAYEKSDNSIHKEASVRNLIHKDEELARELATKYMNLCLNNFLADVETRFACAEAIEASLEKAFTTIRKEYEK